MRRRRLDILDGRCATNFRGGGEVRLTATRAHDSHVSLKTSLKKITFYDSFKESSPK